MGNYSALYIVLSKLPIQKMEHSESDADEYLSLLSNKKKRKDLVEAPEPGEIDEDQLSIVLFF